MALFNPGTANKLERVGAALQGNLGQFDQSRLQEREFAARQDLLQSQQKKQLTKERTLAAAIDSRSILDKLNNGRTQDALQTIQGRLQAGSQLPDFDPSDTLEIQQMIQGGDIKGAIGELEAFDRAAVIAGVIPKMEAVKDERTTLEKNLKAAGLDPGSPEFQAAVLASVNKPATTVNVGAGEGTERKEIGKLRAKQFGDVIDRGNVARTTLANLDQLESIAVETGALEPAKVAMASILEGFGVDARGIANAANAEAFNAVSNRLVNNVLNAAKGPQTEGDAKRAKSTIASLGDTPVGREFKQDSLRALSLREVEMSDFIETRVDNGSTFTEAKREWNKFKTETPSLSATVKNPNTGLPVFFFQFQEIARSRRPGITDDEIVAAWRNKHGK